MAPSGGGWHSKKVIKRGGEWWWGLMFWSQITLRVKESEVQCLKQEITSLRDDLQAAQRVRIQRIVSNTPAAQRARSERVVRSRCRTRGAPQRSAKTCTRSWASPGPKQRERWRRWGKTWGWLIALWTTTHHEQCPSTLHFTVTRRIHPLESMLINPGALVYNLISPPFYVRF